MWQCELGVAQHSDIYQIAGDFFFFLIYATALEHYKDQMKGIYLQAAGLWPLL